MNCPVCAFANTAGAMLCASCGASLLPAQKSADVTLPLNPALPGGTDLSGGAFRVGQVLGQGGFGITYKGGDVSLRRLVAIKEFFPGGSVRNGLTVSASVQSQADAFVQSRQNFLQEARTLARFNHPGIVRVFSVFEENNTAYMVMEFLEGETLAARLAKGVLGEVEAIDLACKICGALEVVHGANLIHRDLKPDNIFLAKEGRAVLIDFGTARTYALDRTVRQTALLTPGYAPLEQYGSTARFGAYSDVYALAATLYHAVTGQAPPPATDRVTGMELRPVNAIDPRLSPALSRALEWAMQLKAEQRPQSVAEFLEALPGQGEPELRHSPARPQPAPVPAVSMPRPVAGAPTQLAGVASVPLAADASAEAGSALWFRPLPNGQLLTNADAKRVFEALTQAMRLEKVNVVEVDSATLKVSGSIGISKLAKTVHGQVLSAPHGNAISVLMQDGGSNERSKALIETILRGTELALRMNPLALEPPPPARPLSATPNSGSFNPIHPAFMLQRPVQGGQGGGVLTLGVLGLFCCIFLAPFAWLKGNYALEQYGDQDPGDRGSVIAGRIMGIIGTCILVGWFLLWIVGSRGS